MSSFFEFERSNNAFVVAIQQDPAFREILTFYCVKNEVCLILLHVQPLFTLSEGKRG